MALDTRRLNRLRGEAEILQLMRTEPVGHEWAPGVLRDRSTMRADDVAATLTRLAALGLVASRPHRGGGRWVLRGDR